MLPMLSPHTPRQSEPCWVPPSPQGPWVCRWTDGGTRGLRKSWLAHRRDLRGERRALRGASADGPKPGSNEARPCPLGVQHGLPPSGRDGGAFLVGKTVSVPGPVKPCPIACDGRAPCLEQVAGPVPEVPQTSLNPDWPPCQGPGCARGLSGLVEAGDRRHGLSSGYWQGAGPVGHFGESPMAAFLRTEERGVLWEGEDEGAVCSPARFAQGGEEGPA